MMSKALNPNVLLVDTHCHVDLFPDASPILAAANSHRILVVAVTNAPSVFFHTKRLAESCPFLVPAVGLHPELVATHDHEIDRLLPLLEETQFVGEVGLDYVTADQSLRGRQRAVFERVLVRCAELGGRVITVHSRRAASDVISTVGVGFNGTVILHWFTGTKREAEQALKIGCYFSVNPAMLTSKSSQQLIAALPRERVLTETDGPFVSHQRMPATPSQTAVVADYLASHWAVPQAEARKILVDNFRRICQHT